jgi:hypothetical protein
MSLNVQFYKRYFSHIRRNLLLSQIFRLLIDIVYLHSYNVIFKIFLKTRGHLFENFHPMMDHV